MKNSGAWSRCPGMGVMTFKKTQEFYFSSKNISTRSAAMRLPGLCPWGTHKLFPHSFCAEDARRMCQRFLPGGVSSEGGAQGSAGLPPLHSPDASHQCGASPWGLLRFLPQKGWQALAQGSGSPPPWRGLRMCRCDTLGHGVVVARQSWVNSWTCWS